MFLTEWRNMSLLMGSHRLTEHTVILKCRQISRQFDSWQLFWQISLPIQPARWLLHCVAVSWALSGLQWASSLPPHLQSTLSTGSSPRVLAVLCSPLYRHFLFLICNDTCLGQVFSTFCHITTTNLNIFYGFFFVTDQQKIVHHFEVGGEYYMVIKIISNHSLRAVKSSGTTSHL